MADEEANHVLVRAKRIFQGLPGESQHEDGTHRPGGDPFRVSRQRRADLKVNDLVEDVEPASEKDEQDDEEGEEAGDGNGDTGGEERPRTRRRRG